MNRFIFRRANEYESESIESTLDMAVHSISLKSEEKTQWNKV